VFFHAPADRDSKFASLVFTAHSVKIACILSADMKTVM